MKHVFGILSLFFTMISVASQQPIRGVWLTNIASDALSSRGKIVETVDRCHRLGFNAIFMVTWNGGYTLFPSETAKAVTGSLIHPDYEGRDPLEELIEEAKKKKIAIHAWFEFGFAASHKDSTGGPLIQNRPEWASRDKKGALTEKNDFYWMNPFQPEVQEFMIQLVSEAVEKYELSGIQGDDRLPALPTNGGYDSYTDSLYRSEHSQRSPPVHVTDYEWVKWRSAKLTDFLFYLIDRLKALDPKLLITMAPSIYPWSEEHYLQDWPVWLHSGKVDYLIPQLYRYDLERYQQEVDYLVNRCASAEERKKLLAGVLLQVNDYNPDLDLLKGMVAYHRSKGIIGEVYFFYEGLKKFEDYFTSIYKNEKK